MKDESVAKDATHLFMVVRREVDGIQTMSIEPVENRDALRKETIKQLKGVLAHTITSITALEMDANVQNESEWLVYIAPDWDFIEDGE